MLRNIRTFTKSSPLFHKSIRNFSGGLEGRVVNKYIISRTPSQKYALFVEPQMTIGELRTKLIQLFPNKDIGITTNTGDLMTVGQPVDLQNEQKQMNQIKDASLLYALLLNNIKIYEKSPQNTMQMLYGIQIAQYNATNKINIPQYIEQGVVDLNMEWSEKKMTVANALSFANIRKIQDAQQLNKQGQQLVSDLTKQQEIALEQSIIQLIKIKRFNTKIGPYLPRANKFMKIILTLMTTNWIFLFCLTYFRYGWNVGEPVSYLTSLGVDLVATMGLFQSNRFLERQKEDDKNLIQSIINLKANQNMAKWRIAYFHRKLSSPSQ